MKTGSLVLKQNRFANFLTTRRNTLVEVIAALFILLFLYTALSKTFQINNTVATLKSVKVFAGFETEIAWGVVIAEYVLSFMLFFPRTRKAGLYGSLAMMTAFTGYIASMMLFVPQLPCSCGGVISKMTWGQHRVFNILFMLLAFTGIILSSKKLKQKSEKTETTPVIFT